MLFVGREAGLVEGATVTVRSHAMAMTMNMEINKSGLFTIVLCMAEFPFMLIIAISNIKLPRRWGSFRCPNG